MDTFLKLASRRAGIVVVGVVVLASGCIEPHEEREALRTHAQELDAFCSINVQTVGMRDMETNYLPQVVACENGNADFEALKAQAVAARAYAYYRLDTGDGSIAPDTSDQAYLCNRSPSQEHFDAVAATSGEVLIYNGKLVAAFYVAGAIPGNRTSCEAVGGDNDPTSTERYVTYNQGRNGGNLEQTTLGWVNSGNDRNRGCKSQNGAHCLAEAGWNYRDILEFYYGTDIQLVQAEGACIGETTPVSCGDTVGTSETILEETSPCFERSCRTGDWWWDHSSGSGGTSVTTYTIDDGQGDCSGRWTLEFEADGAYTIWTHATDVVSLSAQAPYVIHHAGGEETVTVSQAGANGWVALGTFNFTVDGEHWVQLNDTTGEPYTGESSTRIMFDALRIRPAGEEPTEDTGMGGQDTGMSGQDTGTTSQDTGTSSQDTNTSNEETGVSQDAGGGGQSISNSIVQPDLPDAGSDEDASETESRASSFNEGGCAVASTPRPLSWPLGVWLGLVVVGLSVNRRR